MAKHRIDPSGMIPEPGQWGGWLLVAGRWLCVIASADLAEVRLVLRAEANRHHVQHRHRWVLRAGTTPAERATME